MTKRNTKNCESTCATPRKVRGSYQTSDLSGNGAKGNKNKNKNKNKSGSPEAPPPTLTQRTSALLRGMNLTMEHHGAPDHIIREMEEQVHSYLDTSIDEGVWLKRCKYLLTFPLAKYLKNDLPPQPDIIFRFTGKLKKWTKPRLNGFNKTNTHLWYSWYQSKRCTLPLSEDVVDESYKKHLEALTSKDPGDDTIIERIFSDDSFQSVLEQVRGTFTAELKYGQPSFEKMAAKTSASFEFTRGSGGQQNYLRGFVGLNSYSRTFSDQFSEGITRISDSPEMHSMHFFPWVYTKNGIRSNYVMTVFTDYGRCEWSTLLKELGALDLDRRLSCTIQAVLEPNKVRIISKGEALPYYACRPFQKSLLKAIQTFNCFRLTGRPLLEEDITDLTKMAMPSDKWFSVDYSAATDGLSWKYSGRILRYLIELFPPETQSLLLRVLGPHDLHYPKSSESSCTEFRGVQTNGQLMGSIISFPILCLANLGVYLLATQDVQKYWTVSQRINHVLINGDDMVYASDPSVWSQHVDIGKKVGLEMSIGKAYVHREYLNINSTSFHCPLHKNLDTTQLRATEVGFLNVGLFYGQHKVQGSNERGKMKLAKAHRRSNDDGIVVNINTLLKGSRPGKESDLLKKLLIFQKDSISEECLTKTRQGKTFSRNLFIPLTLGGMGVIPPIGFRWKLSKEEIYVAHGYLMDNPDCGYTSQMPLPGYPLELKAETYASEPWNFKQGGEDMPKPIVPVRRIFTKKIKHLCRVGCYFFVPNRSVPYAPVPENERERVVNIGPISFTMDDDSISFDEPNWVQIPKRVYNSPQCSREKSLIKTSVDTQLSSDMSSYHRGPNPLFVDHDFFVNEFFRLSMIDLDECPQIAPATPGDYILAYINGYINSQMLWDTVVHPEEYFPQEIV